MTEVVMALALGLLFGLGTFLVLRRDVVRVVWGVAIISQAANLYLVTMGFGLTGAEGAGVPIFAGPPEGTIADPLVQALVLTAIVIGFGTTAFALVLTFRVYEENGTIDLAELASNPFEGPAAEAARADGGTADAAPSGDGDRADATDGTSDAGPDDGGEA
jgi:multicomponent Na+:H+ antiporter subunit C